MAENTDLGTAHGKIKITSEVDTAALQAKLLAIKQSMNKLGNDLSRNEKLFNSFQNMVTKVQRSVEATSRSVSNMSSKISDLGKAAVRSAVDISGLDTSLQGLVRTGQRLNGLVTTVNKLRSTGGRIDLFKGFGTDLVKRISGINREMNNFPKWTRHVQAASAVLTGLGIATAAMAPRMRSLAFMTGLAFPAIGALGTRMKTLAYVTGMAFPSIDRLGRGIRETAVAAGIMGPRVQTMIRSMSSAITGAALLTSGFRGLAQQISALASVAKFASIGLVGLAAIGPISSIVLGLADAIKQLSGAFLILPGAVATLIPMAGVAAVAFLGLKKAMSAAFGDADKFDDAVKDMDPHMQKLAKSVQGFKEPFKELGKQIQGIVFGDLAENIEPLINRWFPLLKAGSHGVAESMNGLVNNFVRFANKSETLKDTATLFTNSRRVMGDLSASVIPFLNAMRDIGTVGSSVFAKLTSGMSQQMALFETWANRVRNDGSLERWMENGIQGFRDLKNTIKDASVGVGQLFKALGGNGGNALERLADGAERFRNAMENVDTESKFGKIVQHIQSSSSQMMGNFIQVGKSLGDAFVSAIPAIESMSQAFGSTLVDGVRLASTVIQGLAKTLHAIGLDGVIGQIAALGVTIRLLTPIIMTVVNALKIMAGAFMIGKIQSGILAAGAALESLALKAGASGKALKGIQATTLGLAGAVSGPLMVALAAVAAVFLTMRSNSQAVSKYQDVLAQNSKNAANGVDELNQAFKESGGVASSKTYEAIGNQIKMIQSNAQDTITALSGVARQGDSWGALKSGAAWGAEFKEIFTFGASDAKEKMQEMTAAKTKALEMQEAFEKAGYSSKELNDAIANGTGYEEMIAHFRTLGDGGKAAAIELVGLRQEAIDTEASYARIGKGPIQLASAVEVLGDKASTASEKLDAMKSALEAMGLLQVSEVEAFSNVQKAIDGLTDSLQEPLGPADQLGSALVKANGALDATNPAAQRLWEVMRPFSESLRSVAASGGDVQAAWSQMAPQMDQIQKATGLSDEAFQKLLATTGLVPNELQILMKLDGMDDVQKQLYVASKSINSLIDKPVGIEVTTTITSQKAIDQLRQAGVWVDQLNAKTGEVKIHFPSEEVKQKYLELVKTLSAQGVDMTASLPPDIRQQIQSELNNGGEGYTIDAKVKTATDDYLNELRAGKTDEQILQEGIDRSPQTTGENLNRNIEELEKRQKAARASGATPGQGDTSTPGTDPTSQLNPQNNVPETRNVTVKVLNADVAKGAVDGIKASLDGLKDKIVKVGVTNADVAWGAVQGIKNAMDSMRDRTVKVGVTNADAAWGAVQGIKNAIDSLQDKSVTIRVLNADVALGAIQGVIDGLNRLGTAANNAANAIQQAMNNAIGAVNNLIGTINNLTNTLNSAAASASASGASLGQGFADGINSKIGAVQEAAMNLANAADAPLPHSPAKIGPFSGKGWTPFRGRKLAEGFAQGIHDGGDQVKLASLGMAMAVSSVMDSIRATFGLTETSFDANRTPGPGGKKYYRDPTISDEQLEEARKQRAKNQESSEADTEDNSASVAEAQRKISDNEQKVKDAEKAAIEARTAANKDSRNEEAQTKAENAEKDLDNARESLKSSQNRLKELNEDAASAKENGGSSSVVTQGSTPNAASKKIDGFVKSMDSAQYSMGGFSAALVDCSGFVSAVANVATGRSPFSERANTTNMREFLLRRGFKEGKGQAGDLSVGWWDKGGGANGHTALTTPSGINAESTTGGVRFGSGSAGARSSNEQFDQFMYLPISRSTDRAIQKTAENTGDTAKATGKTIPLTRNADGTYSSSDPAWNHLIQRESGGNFQIVQQVQDVNSGGNEASGGFQIAKGTWAANGGTKYAPTAGQATAEQQAEIAAKIFEKSGGAPWGAGMSGRESESALRAGLVNRTGEATDGSSGGNLTDGGDQTETIDTLRKQNQKLNNALSIAQDSKSSDAQVIQALQDIDDSMVGMSASQRETVDAVRESIMTDRGLKPYDPYENAPETPQDWFDTVFTGIAQNLLSIFNTIEQGFQQGVEAVHLLSRGFSNTKDVNTFVDGIQSIVGSITQVATTVGNIIESVGNIAAAVGSAIPGIGQVGTVIGGVTGVIGSVNSVIDFAQEIGHIGGRLFGGALSNILGFLGGTGELQGQVKMLLDMNDNTLKTWSDRNAADKAVIGMPGTTANDPNQTSNFRDLNIYQGPGQDPAEMMNNAMFAVSAHSQGVYGS